MTRVPSRPAWAALCAIFLAAGPARAQPAELTLELDGCVALDEPTLRELVELELETLGISPRASTLRIRCDANLAMIRLRRNSGAWFPIEVRVELGDTAEGARSRLVALAATELLAGAARSREPETIPTTAARTPEVPKAAPTERDERTEESRKRPPAAGSIALHATGNVAIMGDPATGLVGASLGAALGLGHTWSFLLDAGYARGVVQTGLADVRWSSWSAFAGPLATHRIGRLSLGAALGLRGGRLSLSADAAQPHEGRRLAAPWVGVAVPFRVEVEIVSALSGLLVLEGGYVLSPVRGNGDDGRAVSAHRGVWATCGAGVAIRF